jgi:hypothetical protein
MKVAYCHRYLSTVCSKRVPVKEDNLVMPALSYEIQHTYRDNLPRVGCRLSLLNNLHSMASQGILSTQPQLYLMLESSALRYLRLATVLSPYQNIRFRVFFLLLNNLLSNV